MSRRVRASCGGIVVAFCSFWPCPAVGSAEAAVDLTVVNAHVLTGNPAQPQAEAIAVRGDRIVAVGNNREIRRLAATTDATVLDLGWRTVLPGFIDAHLHPQPDETSSSELRFIQVDTTIIGGEVVFQRLPGGGPYLLPATKPVRLKSAYRLGPGPARESSGIVRSRRDPDLFWVINDSGDEPRIYPVHRDGTLHRGSRRADSPKNNPPGVLIGDAVNVDWEDVAADDQGQIIVADFGNNRNDRRDLTLYVVDEPAATAGQTTVKKKVLFCYPDQTAYPAERDAFNFDAEAIYTLGDRIYILTKHRSDTATTLYRLDEQKPSVTNKLTRIDDFEIHGQVVAADSSRDGRHVVVATYQALWLFDVPSDSDNIFRGPIRYFPYRAPQVESVCFIDDDTLLLTDEATAELFEVKIADFAEVARE